MSDRAAVLFVNEAFYDAFRNRDYATMERLWARRAEVACIHPGWEALSGRASVMASWQRILGAEPPAIACRHAEAFLDGDRAFVICYEVIAPNVLVATNLFRREGDEWKLVHHQAGPCNLDPAALEEPPAPSRMQ